MRSFVENSLFYGAAITIAGYVLGMALKKRYKLAVLNPILIAAAAAIGINAVIGVEYEQYQQGAGMISYWMTPATVCLAVPLYEQLQLLRGHWRAVAAGLAAGVVVCLFLIWGMAAMFGLPHDLYVSLLPKSVTGAIALGITEELGGVAALTVAATTLTGVFGSMVAERVFRICRIREPIAKGTALGMSSHAIGTAKAMEMGAVEGAMSSLAIVVAGLMTVIGASFFAQLL